jgi:predicted amidohydrolase YtcJ
LVDAAVNRRTASGRVIGPAERISPYDALRAVTVMGAYQIKEEKSKGSLEPGKLADLVIIERNPLKVDPATIKDIAVLETIKEGKPIFQLGVDKIDAASAQAASRVAATPELAEQRTHRH